MEVRSDGPLRAGSLVFRSASGAFTFTVVAKATFLLTPGESPLVTEGADGITAGDVHWGDDPRQSLRYASDLVPFKRFPEVLVTGSAYTPSGRVLGSIVVRVAVAEIDKVIEVQGERYFDLDGNLSEPASWTRMPLRWERAAGGPGTANPVGVPTGPDASPDQWGRIVLPNLCPAWSSVSSPEDVVPTIGLGPLSPDWPERRLRLHHHAATWDARAPIVTLPEDFDPAYYNAAPADQHMSCLTGDEAILLENLHPEHARLTTRLQRISPAATLALGPGGAFDIPLVCDTLWIDTDRGVATLTYRGHLHVADPAQPGAVIVGLRGSARDVRPSPPRGRSITVELPAPADDLEVVTAVELEEEDAVLLEDVESTVTVAGNVAVLGALLPFAQAAQVPDAARASLPQAAPPSGVPFVQAAPASSPGQAASPEAMFGQEATFAQQATLGERLVSGTTTLAQSLHARASVAPEPASTRAPEPFVPPPTPASESPAPPPLLGALGVPESVPAELEDTAAPDSPAEEPEPPGPPPLPLEAFPLERCAAITASLDRRPEERAEILEAESLDEEMWERLVEHWRSALDRELARHKNALLRAHDAAYVARLEEERGPIAAHDYARLSVAAEVSDPSGVLAELSIPAPAWPRIRRVWFARMAKDPKLAAIVRSLRDQEP